MNWNKIICQKYVFEQNKYYSSPILELLVKIASQICHENTNTPLDGAYLADFGIDISLLYCSENRQKRSTVTKTFPLDDFHPLPTDLASWPEGR